MLIMHVYPYLFDTSHSFKLSICIEWVRAMLNWYLKMSSKVFSCLCLFLTSMKESNRRKNILTISACIDNVRAPFNTPLKISEHFVIIIVNHLPPSFDSAHWRPYLYKIFLIQLYAASEACFNSLLFALCASGSDLQHASHNKLCNWTSLKKNESWLECVSNNNDEWKLARMCLK